MVGGRYPEAVQGPPRNAPRSPRAQTIFKGAFSHGCRLPDLRARSTGQGPSHIAPDRRSSERLDVLSGPEGPPGMYAQNARAEARCSPGLMRRCLPQGVLRDDRGPRCPW